MQFVDEKRLISTNNQKLCSKPTFSQNRRFDENAHTDRIFMSRINVNERVYPYVHNRNVRFSRISCSGCITCKYERQSVCEFNTLPSKHANWLDMYLWYGGTIYKYTNLCVNSTPCRRNHTFQTTVLWRIHVESVIFKRMVSAAAATAVRTSSFRQVSVFQSQ